ncbi:motility associated factor glycosyltransferase family protein [Helicobacter zhangjianzhongii]|uniref:Motility associated factor glycosyltransferase family protein n=1 Tax=Helicobacter zhangjianzhongii TaxID=2974574 RepID=A0ACC6FQU7_9HELI|nr:MULTISPECIES: motility associated factor glycosyltransferase family protein [unclassified Helicobacter]MDL0079499.1 motility associated factor glycosyltransferase family protein [Helicobacter sp. CPD2-1]MDL0081600.1 motility associated factor glycosyltransferase family protein [Helicobacter sp. XJK30-2]
MSHFDTNLAALAKVDALLYLALKSFKPNQHYEVFMDNDPANYNIIDTKNTKALYLTKPIDEIMERNAQLHSYSYYPFLYLYGLGNGVLIRLLFNEQRQRIVVFEPELEIIFIVLNLLDFSSEIATQKLQIIYTKQISYMGVDSLFDSNKYSRVFVKTYDLLVTCPYYESYHDDILRINGYFIKAIEQAVVSVGNDARDSVVGIYHHIANLPDALRTPSLKDLVLALRGRDSAIIISTGPSLHKQLPLLKKVAPYATLLCVDASFPILTKHGIKPDIVLSLERVQESAKFYTDTPKQAQKGVVFALTSIVHKHTKLALKGAKVCFSFRPFGYTSLFGFDEYGYLGIGMSAANMAYELAMLAEFKQCIFIGQDLAFGDDGSSHSKDAIYGTQESQYKKEGIYVPRYGGEGQIETSKIWKLFLHFFEKDIARTPPSMQVINATQGGARIAGTKELPFTQVVESIVQKAQKKPPLLLAPPSPKHSAKLIKQAYKKAQDIIKYGSTQKRKIERVFLQLARELEHIEKLNAQNKLEKINFAKLNALSDKIDDIKGLFGERKFTSYFMDAIQSYIFHQELDIAKVLVLYTANEDELKAKQLQWLYYHKYWLFSLAGGIDCVIHTTQKALDEWSKQDLALASSKPTKRTTLS